MIESKIITDQYLATCIENRLYFAFPTKHMHINIAFIRFLGNYNNSDMKILDSNRILILGENILNR